LHFCDSSTGVRWQTAWLSSYEAFTAPARRQWQGKKMITVSKFDAADYLDDEEAIAVYPSEALETGDSDHVSHALNTVARAKGMTDVPKEALNGNAKPKFDTIRKLIESFGLRLVAKPMEERKGSSS
jgi:probable addiction module antidote protein